MKDQLEKAIGPTGTPLYKIKNETPIQNATLTFIHSAWGTIRGGKLPPFFPGPQPISIERQHFQTLKQNEYYACEKTDGVRYMCVTFKFEDTKLCVLVNRRLDMFLLPLNLPKKSYDGTILDGELAQNNKNSKWYFLVYDAVLVEGQDVRELGLVERLTKANSVAGGIRKLSKDPVIIKMKNFQKMNNLKNFCENHLDNMDFNTDGLIFTPTKDPICVGTHETLFKWKPRDKNTIDFQMIYREKTWGLYIQDKGKLFFQSEITHQDAPEWFIERGIVECSYDREEFKWIPLGLRTDKTYPNNRRTFYRTMVNISENIETSEFYNLA